MSATTSYGTNIAFIEELYEKYRHNPASVSSSWQEFFQDYEPSVEGDDTFEDAEHHTQVSSQGASPAPKAPATPTPQPAQPAPTAQSPRPVPVPPPATAAAKSSAPEGDITPLRGVASKIVQNMESSLAVPTATSIRNIPVKSLEENRRIINHHLGLVGQSKASFTHVIAWAIVKALKAFPRLNAAYASVDGQASRVDHAAVNIGLAVDVEKKDGSRSLVVPNIKNAQSLDFAAFLKAYNDVIRKARSGSLEISDLEGTTISLTNPGTIGTVASIPRLMQSMGAIIATGQIDYPAEYSATNLSVLAELGISKVMTMTSTYDHRIIQGAESGAFLAKIHALLLGEDNFYEEMFRDLRIPYEPMRWTKDRNASLMGGVGGEANVWREASVLQLINAYRVRGHLLADLDPLEYRVGHHPELNPHSYDLTLWDLDRDFPTGGLSGKPVAPLREILDILRDTYCGKIGPEYMHIQNPVQKRWLQDRMEPARNSQPLPRELQRRILMKLNDAEAFEKFLHTKYVGHKRFSLEGAETAIPMLDRLLNLAGDDNVEEVVMGMAHRGRLNVLATVLGKSYEKIFHEFEGDVDPRSTQGSGDVKYHLGAEGRHLAPSGKEVKLTLASNPSHLEAVDPIVEGMARAKQKLIQDRTHSRVIPLLIHGDAAFAGQGVVAETLNLSQLKGYRTGGTIHLVINNQIGFTTGPEDARSSMYATDVAKMVQAPIFHVNGDDPEACVRVMQLAYDFRQEFHKDVVIDMICYRRHGHNEGDEPSLTQPKMYKLIKEHRSVRKLYTESLLRRGDLDPQEAEQWLDAFQKKLQEAFERTREATTTPPPTDGHTALWTDEDVSGFQSEPSPDTAVPQDKLLQAGRSFTIVPESFNLHPKLRPVIAKRKAMLEGKERMDWGLAEALAFGTLMLDGFRVRLSGQDSGRGTFSHRHAILFDFNTGKRWVPLNQLSRPSGGPAQGEVTMQNALDTSVVETDEGTAGFSVYDSSLSEYGVLGFEYGYSVSDPGSLVLWEAQFGDFMNGGQIIVDQFLSSGEEKWGQHSGLSMLLPHGYEGQGPEHSSARLERFLTLCAEGNMQVVNVTTPAQYFHLLRRQMKNEPRKPLIVMTPKSLLRHPAAMSNLTELTSGRFEPVLDDSHFSSKGTDASPVQRIVLTAGKVYYELAAARDAAKANVAIVRLEQFYPWPRPMLAAAFERYPNAKQIVWVQEEPKNMGGWGFVQQRLRGLLKDSQVLSYVGRPISASPATGSHRRHEEQQKALVEAAITVSA